MNAQLTFFRRKSAPYVADSDTSQEAAASIEPHLTELQMRVLECIARAKSRFSFSVHRACERHPGLTCQEVETKTGLDHQTVSPRILELRRMGLIEDSGHRRKTRSGRNAIVWRVVK